MDVDLLEDCASSSNKYVEDESTSLTSKPKTKRKARQAVDKDKVRKKKEVPREKLEALLAKKRYNNMQPEECMKFMEIFIDSQIIKFDFYLEARSMLESSSVQCTFKSLDIPSSITWTRIIEEDSIDDDNKVKTAIRKEKDKQVLIIWSWEKVVEHVHNDSFEAAVMSLSDLMPESKLTFVFYGLNSYFEYHQKRNKKMTNLLVNITNYPKINWKNYEIATIKMQINAKCNFRLIDSAVDMSLLIYQYTKSIAEIPYKMATRNRVDEQLSFYAAGENRNTVKVDKDGYGLRKLWIKQLCSFNNTGLSIAEAICAVYPSPSALMDAYIECETQEEGENLLKDIPIRRGAGLLSSARRLGPELSRKIYIQFTSTDPEQSLK